MKSLVLALLCAPASLLAQTSETDDLPDWTLPEAETQTFELDFIYPEGRPQLSAVDLERGLILVKGSVGGNEGWILIDTGTSATVVNTAFVRRFGGNVSESTSTVTTGISSAEAQRTAPIEFAVADQIRFTAALASTDLSAIEDQLERPIAGIIGMDILRNLSFAVSRLRDGILFAHPSAINLSGPNQVTIIASDGAVDATISGRKVRLQIDTGSNRTLSLIPSVWDELTATIVETGQTNSTDAFGAVLTTRYAEGLTLEIGEYSRTVRVARRPTSSRGVDGLLGLGFFESGSVVFDLGRGLIHYFPVEESSN